MELQIDELMKALREGSNPFPGYDGWEIDYHEITLVLSWDCKEDCWKISVFNKE